MTKKNKKWIGLCICLIWAAQSMTVLAASGPKISMQAGPVKEKDTQVQVSCEIEDGIDVTSGKLRFLYDASQLTLHSDNVGAALQSGLCKINDPLTGNKEEGEIVASFALSEPIPEDGSLVDMTFQLNENVKAGDQLEISLSVEQLSGNSGNISAEAIPLSVQIEAGGGAGGDTPDPPEENQGEKQEPEQKTPAKKEPVSPKDNSKSSDNSSKTKSKAAKTGDLLNPWLYIVGLGAAGAGIAAVKGKRTKKQGK